MNASLERGYLVIADITGFTAFVAATELDHAQAVLRQVLERLIGSLAPTLRLVDVEGDAVFVFGLERDLTRGELVSELVEATYAEFRNLRTDMVRNATCPCRACQSIESLDLKFVTHFGEFALQTVAGKTGPMGSSVNLTHRLLKNDVGARTGWRGYALYTGAALDAMALSGEGMHRAGHEYEHLGAVVTHSADLDAWYGDYVARRRVRLGAAQAHVELERAFDQPRAVVWDWLNDPAKRTQWMFGSSWSPGQRPGGRTGTNARNHCATFDVLEHVLDWRPFDYYTIRLVSGRIRVLATVSLKPRRGGTRLRWRIALESQLPRWAGGLATRLLLARRMRIETGLTRMAALMNAARRPGDQPKEPTGDIV
jgi:hypothetical protein